MRLEPAPADRPKYSALRRVLRAGATTVGRACDRAVRRVIAIVMLIGAATSSSPADTVRPGSAIALPYGDIIIPVPAPPSNADPMNPASPGDVVTQRYNNLRTGATLHGGLDQRAVSDGKFGFLKALDVDGVVLAQPLFMAGVNFPQGRRSAVFIATSTNWVYAFDADTLEKLWGHFLGEPFRIDTAPPENCTGQMAVTEQEPGVAADGIQSTPVIDVARLRIIVSYRGMDGIPDGTQRIAALDLRTGQLAKGADGRDLDRRVTDNPLWNLVHRNRASLLLDGDHVYVAFAGRCEQPDWPHKALSFQGWIYAFDAATLAFEGRYRSTRQPNGSASLEPTKDPVAGGGIWQASTGLAADGRGSLYFATGNQATGFMAITRPADALGRNLPDSVVRLRIDTRPGSISMTPTDWFTPYRYGWLDVEDLDLGSGGVVLIPNTRYLVAAGKEGMLYVLDRENMGKFDGSAPVPDLGFTSEDKFSPDDPGRDQLVQKFRISENQYCAATGPNPLFCLGPKRAYPQDGSPHRGVDMHQWFPWPHIHGTPVFGAFPDGRAFLYVWGEKDFLKSFLWWGKRFETTPTIATKFGSREALLSPPYIANVPGTDGKLLAVGMPGGFLSLTIDPTQPAAGVLFASVQRCRRFDDDPALHECSVPRCQDASNCREQGLGMLRAFDPITLHELWNNQSDLFASDEDKRYHFAKYVPPTIAHGRVFLATGSRSVLVYGRH
ncbi:MAG: hypothetical protein ACREQT_12015 [Candidatus Binataceae bacterium]